MLVIWIASLFVSEPDCGIPMKTWVSSYLMFRLVKYFHHGVGILLVLNETPIYYKPIAKMIIFTIFEQFEFWWMVTGEYLFFFCPQNNCKLKTHHDNKITENMTLLEQQEMQQRKVSHNFLYIVMLVLCLFGIIIIINGLLVFHDIVSQYLFNYINRFENFNN